MFAGCLLAVSLCMNCLAGTPRYTFRAGDSIEYRRTITDDDGKAAAERIEFHVHTRQSDSAGMLAIVSREGGPPTAILWFDVNDRGQIRVGDEMRTRLEPADGVFELLPTLAPALGDQEQWLGEPDEFGRILRQRRVAETGASLQVRFEGEDPTGVSGVVGDALEGAYWFDAEAGLVTRVDAKRVQGGRHAVRVHSELIGRETLKAEQISREARMLDRLRRVFRVEDAFLDELTAQPARVETNIRRLEHIWSEFLDQPPRDPQSVFSRFAEAQRQRAVSAARGLRERAQLAGQWLGAPAAQWSLQDEAGKTVTSESVRKGVTVECFWSSKSSASLRMLATLAKLPAEWGPSDPLGVACINLDADLAAGQRAARACSQGVLTVFSGPPIQGETPYDLPVMRILDEKGRVVRVLFGWRPSILEAVRSAAGRR
ncbi:MAG: hypothetical protein HZB38_10330 [Planctomycetes bacterium]|nr:hypothetical protein [Planctomycetota bacterium]